MAFTFFFRDITTIDEAVKNVIPQIEGRRQAYIWDAGCAMGPELYTLAIVLAENMGRFAFRNIRIYGTDVDESGNFGETVAKGVYPYEELKRIPEDLFKKYFEPADAPGYFAISSILRESVIFRKHDLLSLAPVRQDFSLIMCKNVLLHFPLDKRIRVMEMFHGALLTDGLLAMENTQQIPGELAEKFKKTRNEFQVYRKN
jgi:chemotaxis protein methyltransferase CheR